MLGWPGQCRVMMVMILIILWVRVLLRLWQEVWLAARQTGQGGVVGGNAVSQGKGDGQPLTACEPNHGVSHPEPGTAAVGGAPLTVTLLQSVNVVCKEERCLLTP